MKNLENPIPLATAPLPFVSDKAAEELLQFFDLSLDLFCISKDGFLLKVNPAFTNILGYSEAELLQQDSRAFIHPDDLGTTRQSLKIINNGAKVVRFENRYRKKNGNYCSISWSVTKDKSGQYHYCVGKDISVIKRYEEDLKHLNERYHLLSKVTSEAIWYWEIDSEKVFWHGINYKKLFGYDVVNDWESYESWMQKVHPDEVAKASGFFEAIRSNKEFWKENLWYRKSDGDYAYVKVVGYFIRNSEGKAVSVIGAMNDITPQKKAEESLIASESIHEQLFNESPVPQVIMDVASGRAIKVNEATLKLYGYKLEEHLSLTLNDIVAPDAIEGLKIALEQLKTAQHTFTVITRHVKKNGTVFTVELAISKIKFNNRPAELLIINDITERLRLEEKVARMRVIRQKKITEAQIKGQEKERLELGKELHDNINQQLTTVKLYMDLARGNENMRLNLIEKSETVLVSIINEIRSLSKSLMVPSLDDISLIEAIEELIESYIIVRKFAIHFDYDGNIGDLPHDLTIALFRVLQEQLNNIAKYADARNVWIELFITAQGIKMLIKDDGKGFDTSIKRKGIGITNIKNRIEICNGTAVIESSPGNGCTIKILIPLDEALIETHTATLKIFIAEDDTDDQEILKLAFSEAAPQAAVTYFNDGQQLFETLQATEADQLPALIVLDYNMPMLDGLETLKRLEADLRLKNIPKVVYSSAANVYYQEQCFSANATAYIEKSVAIDDIKQSIKQMIAFCS